MTGPWFGALDQNLKTQEKYIPDRLQPTNLKETIEDTAGGMIQVSPPLSGQYNDTLGQFPLGVDSAALGSLLAGMIPGATWDATNKKLIMGSPNRAKIRGNLASTAVSGSAAITLATTVYNSNLDLTTNAGRITIPAGAGGGYYVGAGVWFPAGASGTRTIGISIDAARANWPIQGGLSASGDVRPAVSDIIPLAAGAIVGLNVFVSGTGVTVQSDSDDDTYLTVVRLW